MAICQFTYSLPENLHLATAFLNEKARSTLQ